MKYYSSGKVTEPSHTANFLFEQHRLNSPLSRKVPLESVEREQKLCNLPSEKFWNISTHLCSRALSLKAPSFKEASTLIEWSSVKCWMKSSKAESQLKESRDSIDEIRMTKIPETNPEIDPIFVRWSFSSDPVNW